MKFMRSPLVVLSVLAMVSLVAAGCAKRAASSSEAIEHAKTLTVPQEQVNYLVGQAQAFLSSKNYQEAIKTAQYVLSNVDANAQAAKDVLEKATQQLKRDAEQAAGDVKKKLGF
jgi:hypothetical protein